MKKIICMVACFAMLFSNFTGAYALEPIDNDSFSFFSEQNINLCSQEQLSIIANDRQKAIESFNESGLGSFNPSTDYLLVLYYYENGVDENGNPTYMVTDTPILRIPSVLNVWLYATKTNTRTYSIYMYAYELYDTVYHLEAMIDYGDGQRGWASNDYPNNTHNPYLYFPDHTYVYSGSYTVSMVSGSAIVGGDPSDTAVLPLNCDTYTITITA